MTRDFQQCDILTSVDSDQPGQPPGKLMSREDFYCAGNHSNTGRSTRSRGVRGSMDLLQPEMDENHIYFALSANTPADTI